MCCTTFTINHEETWQRAARKMTIITICLCLADHVPDRAKKEECDVRVAAQ